MTNDNDMQDMGAMRVRCDENHVWDIGAMKCYEQHTHIYIYIGHKC